MRVTRIRLAVPAGFSLRRTADAHGWPQLAPYRMDPVAGSLTATWRLGLARPLDVTFTQAGALVVAETSRSIGEATAARVAMRAAYAFAFDVDLRRFHRVCRAEPRLFWIAKGKFGRFLRAEDAFEDALKTLLTTNCTWTQTKAMAARLCERAGLRCPESGSPAFPTPEAVLRLGALRLKDDVKLGYRADAAAELARRAIAGEIEAAFVLPADEARAAILEWRGFGPYAASSLLQLLGRNDAVIADSWALAQARKHGVGGRKPTAESLARHYRSFGAEAARVAWFDLNREHFAAPTKKVTASA